MSCNFSESKSFCEVRGDRARGQERSSEVSGDRGARRVEVHLPRADDEDVLWAQSGAIGAQSERNRSAIRGSERNPSAITCLPRERTMKTSESVCSSDALSPLSTCGGLGWFGFGLGVG